MKLKKTSSLVLRCNSAEMKSHGGFQWPSEIGAEVVAPDWINNADCGNGLHGWLYGAGDHSVSDYASSNDSKWLVVEVATADIVMLGGKCKFPKCVIRFIGAMPDAAEFIRKYEQRSLAVEVIGAQVIVGEKQLASTGYRGTATAGESGTATAGESGTATAGYRGTATAGNWGTATAGNWGTATAGESGTATAGESGTVQIKYWDSKASRWRIKTGYVGEDGIKPDTKYKLNDQFEFEECK